MHASDPIPVLGAIELGGTKTVAAVADGPAGPIREMRFPTTLPAETLGRAAAFLRAEAPHGLAALGVAAFGPVVVDPARDDFGRILMTPKAGWAGFDVVGELRRLLPGVPVGLDTDVNAAVLAEASLGAAQGCRDAAYITVGTGIGAGILVDGRVIHGTLHTEFGHFKVPRHDGDSFPGCCPFHGDCLEGMASGTAMGKRWGTEAGQIPPGHPAWAMEAWYLAHGCLALLALTPPRRIVLGGGVPQAPGLIDAVNERLIALGGGYFESAREPGVRLVVPPALGQEAGIRGAFVLAREAARG